MIGQAKSRKEEAQQLEEASRKQYMKMRYKKVKLYGNTIGSMTQEVRKAMGELATSEEEFLEVWKKHIDKVLNPVIHPYEIILETLGDQGSLEGRKGVSTEPPSEEEIERAMKQLKNGEAAGIDNITSEILKASRTSAIKALGKI
ncbi:unnamed protein product [Caretta caretta]